MQKLLLLLISIIVGFFISAKAQTANGTLNFENKTMNLSHFDEIHSEAIFSVEVKKSNEEKIEITSNYLQFVDVITTNNTLVIRYKRNQSLENADTRIVIYAKDLHTVNTSLGSVIKIKDKFDIQKVSAETGGKIFANSEAKKLSVNTESGGSFLGTINVEDLVLNAESGSSIDIQGKIGTAKITCAGASKIMAAKTNISVATVNAESASSVSVSVSKELTASASSMAKIRYKTLSGIKFTAKRDSGGKIDSI